MRNLLLLLSFLGFAFAKKEFNGYKVLRVPISNDGQASVIKQLTRYGVDFWRMPTVQIPADIVVPPDVIHNVTGLLDNQGISYTYLIENLQDVINEEREANDYARKQSAFMFRTGTKSYDRIHTYYAKHNEINSWCERLASEFRSFVSTFSIGKTHEGRNMKVLKISNGPNKPAIWIDGGIHAREWIAPSVVMYIAWKIIDGYGSNNARITRRFVDSYDWYFLPVANPDGYDFTHGEHRLWRKNRRPDARRQNCLGVDPNRNFGFHWAEPGTMSTGDPCDEIYHGPSAFSEAEPQNMRQQLLKLSGKLQVYLSFHSYSQLWFVPWGYTKDYSPADNQEALRVARIARDAVFKRYKHWYEVGTPGELLYPAGGGSYDWAKGVAGAKYSYTIELRPDRYQYVNGFVLPPSSIRPTGEEIWAGVKTMVNAMKRME